MMQSPESSYEDLAFDAAYEEGYAALTAGLSMESNPYWKSAPALYAMWICGFTAADLNAK